MTKQSHCVSTIKNYGNFKLADRQSLCVEVKVRITYLIFKIFQSMLVSDRASIDKKTIYFLLFHALNY